MKEAWYDLFVARRRASSVDRVLDAAEELFASRGYAGTSIAEICERSSVRVGSVYHHFGSKEKLLVAVLRRADEAIEKALEDAGQEESVYSYYEHAVDATVKYMPLMRIDASLGLSELEPSVQAEVLRLRARTEFNVARELRRHCHMAGVSDCEEFVADMTNMTIAIYYGGIASDSLSPGLFRAALLTGARLIEGAIKALAERPGCDGELSTARPIQADGEAR